MFIIIVDNYMAIGAFATDHAEYKCQDFLSSLLILNMPRKTKFYDS